MTKRPPVKTELVPLNPPTTESARFQPEALTSYLKTLAKQSEKQIFADNTSAVQAVTEALHSHFTRQLLVKAEAQRQNLGENEYTKAVMVCRIGKPSASSRPELWVRFVSVYGKIEARYSVQEPANR